MGIKSKYYVIFINGHQAKFLKECKLNLNLPWKDIASLLKVNRSMIFQYINETSRLPKSSFMRLIKVAKIEHTKYAYSFGSAYLHGNATIPNKLNSDLAEFIGIFLGDGNMYNSNYQITISCGLVDGSYIQKFVPLLVKKLFSKRGSFRRMKKNSIDFRFSSKIVCNFLKKEYSLKSPKIDSEIPIQLFTKDELLRSCIRGLIDTDGGIHAHHKNSAQIKFTNKSKKLIDSTLRAFKYLGFKVSTTFDKRNSTYSIYLFGKEVIKYFEEIGFHNPKNRKKYLHWINKRILPSNKELKNAPAEI